MSIAYINGLTPKIPIATAELYGLETDNLNDYVSTAYDANTDFDIADTFSFSVIAKLKEPSSIFSSGITILLSNVLAIKGIQLSTNTVGTNVVYLNLVTYETGLNFKNNYCDVNLPKNNIFHFVVTYNNGTVLLYVNGVLKPTQQVGLGTVTSCTSTVGYKMNINDGNTNYCANQILIDNQIYDKVLSLNDINTIFDSFGKKEVSNCLAHWNFDINSGLVVPESVTGNNGTINGQPTGTWVVVGSQKKLVNIKTI